MLMWYECFHLNFPSATLCLKTFLLFYSSVDQSMFENCNAAEQPKLNFRQAGSTLSPAASIDTSAGSKTGGSQHLKNALNLGKAMGAKVNDLLRRKDPSTLGDIGVTEVNKNVEPVWSSLAEMGHTTARNRYRFHSHSCKHQWPQYGHYIQLTSRLE